MHHRGPIMRIAALLGVPLLMAIAATTWTASQASADTPLTINMGVGSGTVAGNVYTPGEFTVHTGDSVTVGVTSDEPHSLTFGSGPSNESPDQWPSTFPNQGPDLGTMDFDGTGFANTALMFNGQTATFHFTAPGTFEFSCEIHPGMTGTVHVVAADQNADTQTTLDQKASQTSTAVLAQVDPLKAATTAQVTSQDRNDGTKLWKIFTNAINDPAAQPGGGTGYLELLQFIPPDLPIHQGDTVEWDARGVHSVTFIPAGQTPDQLEAQYGGDPFAVPPSKPSDNYDASQVYNSGMFFAGPGAPTSFSLTFTQTGTFPYLCLLHEELGQTGTITVAARAATATPTPTPAALPQTGGPPQGGGGMSWLAWLMLGGGLAMLASGVSLGLRRVSRSL